MIIIDDYCNESTRIVSTTVNKFSNYNKNIILI
jgi:hypothetical protein